MSLFAIDSSQPDLSELAAFFASQTNDSAEAIYERLKWLSINPSRRADVPFAWCARASSGAIAGAMMCVPHRLVREYREHTVLMSSGFYVDPSVRGAGLEIFLRFRALSSRFPLYATTTNAQATRVWQWAGAKPLAGANLELLRPIRPSAMVEEMLVRRLGPRSAPFARAIAPLASITSPAFHNGISGELTPVDSAEEAVVSSGGEDLQPVRDAAFIRWRFFDVPQVRARVYRYQHAATGADGFVALTHSRRGYRSQIRALFLADFWGRISVQAFPGLLNTISREYLKQDVLVIRCVPQRYVEQALTAHCIRRDFPGAVGWCIDSRGALGPDPVFIPAAATETV